MATTTMTTTTGGPSDAEPDKGWSAEGAFEDQAWLRAVYGVIATLGIAGNALVMLTVARVPELRTLTNMFIVSLAVCDFVTSVFLIPLHLGFQIPVPEGLAGDMMCRLLLSKFPLWTSFVASVLTLTCVTLERYLSIVHPFRYVALFTPAKAGAMVAGVWAAAVLVNSYFFYVFSAVDGRCSIGWSSPAWQRFVGVGNFCAIYVLPLTLMAFSYWSILSSLRRSALSMRMSSSADAPENRLSRDLLRARRKVVRMLMAVVVTFAVCWAPNQFLFFAYMCGWALDFSAWYYHASVLVAFCNSCVNPLIYGFQSRQYRAALRRALRCCCCRAAAHRRVGDRPGGGGGGGTSLDSYAATADIREHYAANNVPRQAAECTSGRADVVTTAPKPSGTGVDLGSPV